MVESIDEKYFSKYWSEGSTLSYSSAVDSGSGTATLERGVGGGGGGGVGTAGSPKGGQNDFTIVRLRVLSRRLLEVGQSICCGRRGVCVVATLGPFQTDSARFRPVCEPLYKRTFTCNISLDDESWNIGGLIYSSSYKFDGEPRRYLEDV